MRIYLWPTLCLALQVLLDVKHSMHHITAYARLRAKLIGLFYARLANDGLSSIACYGSDLSHPWRRHHILYTDLVNNSSAVQFTACPSINQSINQSINLPTYACRCSMR